MISAIEKLRKWLDYKVNRFDPYRNTIILNTGAHPDELYNIADETEAADTRLQGAARAVPELEGVAMTDNRTTMSRFKRWREVRKLKRRIIALGTFISNHGWYPGVRDDCKRLEAMERKLKEMTV